MVDGTAERVVGGISRITREIRRLPSSLQTISTGAVELSSEPSKDESKKPVIDKAVDVIVIAGGDRKTTEDLLRKIEEKGLTGLMSFSEDEPGYDYWVSGGNLPEYGPPAGSMLLGIMDRIMDPSFFRASKNAREERLHDLPGYVHRLAYVLKRDFRELYLSGTGSCFLFFEGGLMVDDLSDGDMETINALNGRLTQGGVQFNIARYQKTIRARNEAWPPNKNYKEAEGLVRDMMADQAEYLAKLAEELKTYPQGDLISLERVIFDSAKLDGGIINGIDSKSRCARRVIGAAAGLQGLMDMYSGWMANKSDYVSMYEGFRKPEYNI